VAGCCYAVAMVFWVVKKDPCFSSTSHIVVPFMFVVANKFKANTWGHDR